uniref:Cytochrome oxidase maturation protein cbb3-type n=1 Tax=Myoviridae sp. ct3wi9 TaxID=2826610 RepID=A0A8S5MXX9_9CAUD|nr:MAG TPA: Cytochrome oxidase maturation protein cbb3-type [Myoviridae sp. ct3wi9]
MGSTFTLLLVMLMFVVYTVVGGIFALVWAVRSTTCLIMQIGKQVTNKLLPGWL